jgi:glucose/arabinose dehydrogenase
LRWCAGHLALIAGLSAFFGPGAPTAGAATLPAGFQESVVFSGLTQPTAVRFAPDGRVFVAEKSGVVKVFDSLSDTSPTVFADLRTNVHNFWDRGLLGLALHPSFPATPYVYVLYTYDAAIGGTAPRWGTPGATSDGCPTPPGPTSDGCVVSGRLSRLRAEGNVMIGSEQVLIEDWCQQYPSHSIGSLAFGSDGALYVSGGDGASLSGVDWGQEGDPPNPCGDPPGGVGATLTPPTAEGGALRSQDLRTSGDPVGLDGTILRVDPATGAALPDNPLFSHADANARRIITYGLRNPFRFAIRPGTSEIWIGDVGHGDWEEIDRISNPRDSILENFGWPCHEGPWRQAGYDSADLVICENLYRESNAVTDAHFSYYHGAQVVPGEPCPSGTSSLSGVAFYPSSGGLFPSSYAGALFFADYSRKCIWVMFAGANGLPDPATVATFAGPAAGPVDLQISPSGDLFYVDFDGGTIRRIRFEQGPPPPTPSSYLSDLFWTSMTNGWGPVELDRSNGENAAGDGRTITLNGTTYAKGLGGHAASDVRYSLGGNCTRFRASVGVDDEVSSAGSVVFQVWAEGTKLYDSGVMTGTSATKNIDIDITGRTSLALIVTNGGDNVDFDHADWANARVECGGAPGSTPPSATIATPVEGTTWQVAEVISFSGSASDVEDGPLPSSALTWSLILHHCPAGCHTHVLMTFSGVASGSFSAPDHEYPSYLELRLTATDSSGLTTTESRLLEPETVLLSFESIPAGLSLVVNAMSTTTPFQRTVITGSTNTISAPAPQTLGGTSYGFSHWSDGGAQTHSITTAASATYVATYTASGAPPANTSPPSISGPARQGKTLTAAEGVWTGSQPMTFAYQWRRCDSQGAACVDVFGATAKTFTLTSPDVGSRIRVVVTATNSFGSAGATSAPTAIVKGR